MTTPTPEPLTPERIERIEDFGPIELAFAEALHEFCNEEPVGHPLAHHSPWMGADLDGVPTWAQLTERLARHGLEIRERAEQVPLDVETLAEAIAGGRPLDETEEWWGTPNELAYTHEFRPGPTGRRALLALYRNWPVTAPGDRYNWKARKEAMRLRDELLAWAATKSDEELLWCRNLGHVALRWIREQVQAVSPPHVHRYICSCGREEPKP